MEIIQVFCLFVFIELVGLSIVSMTFKIENDILLSVGLSYGLGVIVLTSQMMLYSFVHIPWNVWTIFLPWIFVIAISVTFLTKIKVTYKIRVSLLEKIFLSMIGITIVFVFLEAILHPLAAFDGWSNWFLGGKAFFLSGKIDPAYIHYANNSNPPLINLLITLVYICLGDVYDHMALFFISGFYLFLLILFYSYLRTYVSRNISLLFTLFLATTENIIRHAGRFDVGHADLPLGYFFFAVAILLMETIKTKSMRMLIVCEFFLVGAILTKVEGIPFFLLVQTILIIYLFSRKRLRYILVFFPFFAVSFSWYVFSHVHGLPQNPFFQTTVELTRFPTIVVYVVKEFFNIGRWNLLWVCFFFSLFSVKRTRNVRIPLFIFFSQLGVYCMIYFMTPLQVVIHITSSFDRLLLHLAPIALFCNSILFAPYLKSSVWITIEQKTRKVWLRLAQLSSQKTKKKI